MPHSSSSGALAATCMPTTSVQPQAPLSASRAHRALFRLPGTASSLPLHPHQLRVSPQAPCFWGTQVVGAPLGGAHLLTSFLWQDPQSLTAPGTSFAPDLDFGITSNAGSHQGLPTGLCPTLANLQAIFHTGRCNG